MNHLGLRMIIYFLPTILALGIITSYEDIKEGKIRNKYLAAAIAVGVLAHIVLVILSMESLGEAAKQFTVGFAALTVAVIIWYIKWWSAGDAKLFTVYSFLFPLTLFENSNISIQIIILLSTMVIPIWLVLFARAMFTSKRNILRAIIVSLKPKQILTSVLIVLSIPWIIGFALMLAGFETNFLISIAGMMGVSYLGRKYLGDRVIWIYSLVLATRIIFTAEEFFSTQMLVKILPLLITYIIMRHFATYLMLQNMHSTPEKNKKHKRWSILKIYLQKEVPFAPIMFLGVLLTTIIVLTINI